jgi:UDPglucose--hexose-1-phosphate uridylyltransferase
MKSKPASKIPAVEKMEISRLVYDEIGGHWIVLAPGRKKRPDGILKKRAVDNFSAIKLKREKIIAVYGRGGSRVTAIENGFPVFRPDRGLIGRQEILVEGGKKTPFAKFSAAQIRAAIEAMGERSRVLRRDPRLKYLVIFKNEGQAAGASQPHPHTQVFGLSFVPEHISAMAKRRRSAAKKRGASLHALALQQAKPELIVYEDNLVVAYAPPEPRLPYEIRLVTRRRLDNIAQTKPAERASLAKALFALFPLIRERGLAYNFYFHDTFADKREHFEIVFTPRPNVWAGFELDTGILVNPVAPEKAAADYRSAAKKARKKPRK